MEIIESCFLVLGSRSAECSELGDSDACWCNGSKVSEGVQGG